MDGMFYQATASKSRFDFREKILITVLKNLNTGSLDITFPSGRQMQFTGQKGMLPGIDKADIHIIKWNAINRMLKGGALGLAEGFIAAEWTSSNLSPLLNTLAANMDSLEQSLPSFGLARFFDKFKHFKNRNTKKGSRKNISFHYDLGNDFYKEWLDETMSYSSALFDKEALTLAEAQNRKYARLAEATGIKPGDHVLEIGCGWGGFAEYAVEALGCSITGVTLSEEQLRFSKDRMKTLKNGHNAHFHLMDYRDIEGQFDHVISIEMFEAVGMEYWSQYFEKLKTLLKPGGNAGIQVITIHNERFHKYQSQVDFIQKYIFPGGMLPSDAVFRDYAENAGLSTESALEFGKDYGKTLSLWAERFEKRIEDIKPLGFDDRFMRMWTFYLAYCEAGFYQQSIDVRQYVLSS